MWVPLTSTPLSVWLMCHVDINIHYFCLLMVTSDFKGKIREEILMMLHLIKVMHTSWRQRNSRSIYNVSSHWRMWEIFSSPDLLLTIVCSWALVHLCTFAGHLHAKRTLSSLVSLPSSVQGTASTCLKVWLTWQKVKRTCLFLVNTRREWLICLVLLTQTMRCPIHFLKWKIKDGLCWAMTSGASTERTFENGSTNRSLSKLNCWTVYGAQSPRCMWRTMLHHVSSYILSTTEVQRNWNWSKLCQLCKHCLISRVQCLSNDQQCCC